MGCRAPARIPAATSSTTPRAAAPTYSSDLLINDPNDTVAAGTVSGSTVTFELRHPLCTDHSGDICASVGRTLGVDFQYVRNPTAGGVSAPGPNIFDQGLNWADLAIAAGDVVAPAVTVTDPATGSTLSGVVPVAATASDNVGVTRVDFSYFDGGTDVETPIGSDTDPPYTATFDSRQFPDTLPQDGTIYATAFDAAGNSTKSGIGVTVNNGETPDTTITSGPGLAFGGTARFTFTSDFSGATFQCSRDGAAFTACETPMTYHELSNGSHTFAVRAVLGAVFDLTPATSNFLVESTPPGRIVFESNRPNSSQPGTDIYSMNPDGTDVQHLTFAEGTESRPSLSPDGSVVAYVSGGDIYTVSAIDPGTPVRLTTTGDNDAPAFSPRWEGNRLPEQPYRQHEPLPHAGDRGQPDPDHLPGRLQRQSLVEPGRQPPRVRLEPLGQLRDLHDPVQGWGGERSGPPDDESGARQRPCVEPGRLTDPVREQPGDPRAAGLQDELDDG